MGTNQISPIQSEELLRFSDHMSFQTNEIVTHRIKAKDYYLYFQPDNPKHTFQYLSQQYKSLSNEELILSNTKIHFSPNQPIGEFGKNYELQVIMQNILNKLQASQEITENQIDQMNKQSQGIVQQLIIKSNVEIKKRQCISIKLKINYYGQIKLFSHEIPIDITYPQLEKDLLHKYQTTKLNANQENINKNLGQKIEQKIHSFNRNYIQIYDYNHNRVTPSNMKQIIFDKTNNQITALIHNAQCQLSYNSQVLLNIKGEFKSVPIPMLQNTKEPLIVGFDIGQNKLKASSNYKVIQKISSTSSFYTIKLQSQQDQIKRQVFFYKGQLVLNEQLDWIRVELLKKGMLIFGINDTKDKIILLTVASISTSDLQAKIETIAISSPIYLNFVIDGIIVHNQNQINIYYNEINEIYMPRSQISVFLHETFDSYFKTEQECFYGNFKVSKDQSFGDYHLQENDFMFSLNHSQINFQQVIISVKKAHHTENITAEFSNLSGRFRELRHDYIGLWNKQIVCFTKQKSIQFQKDLSITHIIAQKNGYLYKILFSKNKLRDGYLQHRQRLFNEFVNIWKQIKPIFFLQFQKIFAIYYQGMKGMTIDLPIMSKNEFFPIYLYTTQWFYAQLNAFLCRNYEKYFSYTKSYKISQEKWVPITDWIMRSLQLLPHYHGKCYRGMKNVSLQYVFGLDQGNETISFNNFTSTSIHQQVAINKFSNAHGIIMTIISRTGKQVTNLSFFPNQKQVLFPPFVNFLIIGYNKKVRPQTITLEQIPVPRTNWNKLLFWVDDSPHNNQRQSLEIQRKFVEVILVNSTRLMQVIIKRFFRAYKLLDKTIIIVSDMARIQNEKINQKAGIQLLDIIYKKHGLTIKSFIYTSPKKIQMTRQKVAESIWPIHLNKIQVVGKRDQLVDAIKKSFHIQ